MSLSDESAANATNGKHPPTPFNIDGEPITYDGNPAHVEGILHELSEWTARTGHYVTLLENNARTHRAGPHPPCSGETQSRRGTHSSDSIHSVNPEECGAGVTHPDTAHEMRIPLRPLRMSKPYRRLRKRTLRAD